MVACPDGNIQAQKARFEEAKAKEDWASALVLAEDLLVEAERRVGSEHIETSARVNDVAVILEQLNRADEAERMYLRCLVIQEGEFGPSGKALMHILKNLATFYFNQRRYDDSRDIQNRLMAVISMHYGSEHPLVGAIYANLAKIYYRQGLDRETEQAYFRAMDIYGGALSRNYPDNSLHEILAVASMLQMDMAQFYANSGRWDEARGMEGLARMSYENAVKAEMRGR